MYKVMCIFGTRPEAIKMAPVIHAIEQHPQLQGIVCISAQHREMLDSVLETFKIKPDHDLNIMKHGQTLHSITCDILERLTPVLQDEKPDMILVHGDTTTTFAAARRVLSTDAIGHVETGLRTIISIPLIRRR
ncbi:MAG: UDP-N-acetylglucosamine 2-epimerase [Merdibacter sp.]